MLFLTLIVISVLAVGCIWRLKLEALVHPALWFCAAAASALACFLLLDAFGEVPASVGDNDMLRRLCTYVNGTCVLFGLALATTRTYRGGRWLRGGRGGQEGVLRRIALPMAAFSLVSFGGAAVNWIGMGAPLTYDQGIRDAWLRNIPVITARAWWPFHLIFPAAFVTAWQGTHDFVATRRLGSRVFFCAALQLVAAYLWILGTGGRQVSGFVMLYWLAGVATGLATIETGSLQAKRAIGRLLTALAVAGALGVVFAFVASATNRARAVYASYHSPSTLEGVPVLGHFGDFIYYVANTVVTYQTYGIPKGRDWSETGPVAINGFLDFGLRELFGLRRLEARDTNPERALAPSGFIGAFGTRNIYYDLEDDFGVPGAAVALVIGVLVSHVAFLRFRRRVMSRSLLVKVPLLIALLFWGYSFQLSFLMHDGLRTAVTAFLCWDVARWVLPGSPSRSRHPSRGAIARSAGTLKRALSGAGESPVVQLERS